MRLLVNVLSQIFLSMCQIVMLWNNNFTEWDKIFFGSLIAFMQIVISVIAHNFNPDGTPSSVAYEKD